MATLDELYNSLIKGVRKPKHKLALFLCGAAGSGKTSSRSTFLRDAGITTTYVTLNLDEIRGVVGTQEEARKVFVELTNRVIENGYSLLYDATCRDTSNVIPRMKELKQKGYTVILGITFATERTILGRIQRRVDQPLDESIARDIYAHLKKNVEKYMSLDAIDEVYLYNNEQTTTLIYKRKGQRIYCVSPSSKFYFDVSKYC
jgi:predicted ABC-type ATPase